MPSEDAEENILVRKLGREDLAEIGAIQAASPQASQWPVADYLQYEGAVAAGPKQIYGFVIWREVGGGEREILNLAVNGALRRQGVGRMLVEAMLGEHPGEVFLEVRGSNQGARIFYLALGFQEVGERKEYYKNPAESAIVMVFHSC